MIFAIIVGGFWYDFHSKALKNIKGVEIVPISDSWNLLERAIWFPLTKFICGDGLHPKMDL